MGANSTQAYGVIAFMLAFVALAMFFAGGGILLLSAAIVLLGVSVAILLKCKAWENADE